MLSPTTLVDAHQDIISESSRPSASTLPVEGFAVRYKLLEDGGRQITAIHVPGHFIDLHSFLLHRTDHGVSSLAPCRLARVPHATLATVAEQHPHLARLLWLMTRVDGSIGRERLVGMGRRTATAHLAHLICGICSRLAVVGLAPNRQFLFPPNQDDVGDMLGLSGDHVNRCLQELRAKGLVQWKDHFVNILDWGGLTLLQRSIRPTFTSDLTAAPGP